MQNSENIGFLIVRVTTAIDAIPISGALVTISKICDGENRNFKSVTTNISGRTESIALEAPLASNSQSPGPSGDAFSTYNIQVEKEGYYTANYLGVPIFAGITSIQTVKLIPYTLEKNLTGSDTEKPRNLVSEEQEPNL